MSFPGGKRVDSVFKEFTVKTDQPKTDGGDGSAPEPYDLFMASIGTCAGVYLLYFCENRAISTDHIEMTIHFEMDEKSHLLEKVAMEIDLPEAFPPKYIKPLIRAVEQCTVKRSIAHPPRFSVTAGLKA